MLSCLVALLTGLMRGGTGIVADEIGKRITNVHKPNYLSVVFVFSLDFIEVIATKDDQLTGSYLGKCQASKRFN